ncbi:MAG: hypothetical protein JSS09_03800 [Verrucomicrobia bacterium]|nr:hypothetical protein [Verrucomicrobiota bacterium]
MSHLIVCRKKAKRLCFALFLIGIVCLSYTGVWWPGIMLAIGIPLSIKQYLLGKRYDVALTLFVFVGVFVTVQFDIEWKVLLPVLFTIGGIYILFRDLLETSLPTEREQEEDLNEEIEENQHEK